MPDLLETDENILLESKQKQPNVCHSVNVTASDVIKLLSENQHEEMAPKLARSVFIITVILATSCSS